MLDRRVVEKRKSLIQELVEKTRLRKIAWERTPDDGVFQASFPGFAIQVRSTHGLGTMVRIFNEDGELIEQITHEDFGTEYIASQLPELAMIELYDTARVIAMGVEEAIDTLLGELRHLK